jgi:hypothetical protein
LEYTYVDDHKIRRHGNGIPTSQLPPFTNHQPTIAHSPIDEKGEGKDEGDMRHCWVQAYFEEIPIFGKEDCKIPYI